MADNWVIDVLIALIGAVGLIIPGWLSYKGAKVGRTPTPAATADHGSEAWQHGKTREYLAADGSRTRDLVARRADDIQRQMDDNFREVRDMLRHRP